MDNLLKESDEVLSRIGLRRLILFFDYDGTLAPIVSHPSETNMSDGLRSILQSFSSRKDTIMAFISGRQLKDIMDLAPFDMAYYSGNHGMEIEGPGIKMNIEFTDENQRLISRAKKSLKDVCMRYPHAFLEDKVFSLVLHYRMVQKDKVANLKREFIGAVGHLIGGGLKARQNKKTLELVPEHNTGKGFAVSRILEIAGYDPKKDQAFYFGDDKTDDDAFRSLDGQSIRVTVGRPTPHADYILKDPEEVEEFLKRLLLFSRQRRN